MISKPPTKMVVGSISFGGGASPPYEPNIPFEEYELNDVKSPDEAEGVTGKRELDVSGVIGDMPSSGVPRTSISCPSSQTTLFTDDLLAVERRELGKVLLVRAGDLWRQRIRKLDLALYGQEK